MIEPVNTQDFTSQPERRKPEQFEHVKFRIDAGVARITLNRPEHNLLNEAMLREIAGGIAHAGERADVKLIVLDSACKVFCGGIDIGEYTSERVFQMLEHLLAILRGQEFANRCTRENSCSARPDRRASRRGVAIEAMKTSKNTGLPGSARVSRVGFGVSPKQSFRKSPRKRDAFASGRDACATQI